MKGSMVKHGATCGYIVVSSQGSVGTVCHGWNDPRRERILLGGIPATLFPSMRDAKRAIRMNNEATKENCPQITWKILRLAYAKKGKAAR